MRLLIAIPTYNRPEQLAATVERLAPQLDENTKIVVLDNHSDVPAAVAIQEFANHPCVEVRRHPCNIGGVANLLRCFELEESDYMWTLGDDDVPHLDAVRAIRIAVKEWPSASFVNFHTLHFGARTSTRRGAGISSFLESIESFSNVVHLSSTVYRMRAMRAHLGSGYAFSTSLMPQVAMMIAALRNDGEFVLTARQIVNNGEARPGKAWSYLPFALACGTLRDMKLSDEQARRLADLIVQNVHPELSFVLLLAQVRKGKMTRCRARNIMRQIYMRCFLGSKCSHKRVMAMLATWGMAFPNASWVAVNCICRFFLGHSVDSHPSLRELISKDQLGESRF